MIESKINEKIMMKPQVKTAEDVKKASQALNFGVESSPQKIEEKNSQL